MTDRIETLLQFAERRTPRYTSYPTAPHFHAGVGEQLYTQWLKRLNSQKSISLYVHIPYCRELCWYCGCNMRATRSDDPIAKYVEGLLQEIALLSARVTPDLHVSHLAFGGGTPTILSDGQFDQVMGALRSVFTFEDTAELAIEIDPRTFDAEKAKTLAKHGFNRASVGIQSFDPEVQKAINRIQSYDMTKRCFDHLREVGITKINGDLLYGLPYQTRGSAWSTAEAVVSLDPDRLAVFGYAHVPHMKSHQNLIPQESLPDAEARLRQEDAIGDVLINAGYQRIGIDHYAKPYDRLAVLAREGQLNRNFQGYTTDDAKTIIALGASSIGRTPEGYVQNHTHVRDWALSVSSGKLPIAKGVEFTPEDLMRADMIERIMCDLRVVPDRIAEAHSADCPDIEIEDLITAGIVKRDSGALVLDPDYRPLARLLAAAFDAYLGEGRAKHSVSV
ncbi:oxygen-independent coproporphyrinogen III oxidase [Woodsholea maritima]|uniref:oxygen-independent coproporphyrinogen III oxidase n=1 Tax=Woodsholea maritima TaxID=240237 RepID=UPI0003699E01|nr:oxygen-independent coproporphyrinogen III oxidase [Woodsholea maritima]